MTMLRNARPSLPRRLASDRRGNVAMMFGLMVLPMLGAVGLAIDFGTIMTARTKAQMAADAAALQASGVVRELIKDSDGSDASTTAAIAEGKRRGDLLFKAHADKASLKDYTIDTVVKRDGQNITATANFTVRTATYLATLFSKESFTAAGDAVSSSSLPAYSDVYFALDISQSMGIAANQSEMIRMYNAEAKTKTGFQQTKCVFGCHAVEGDYKESFMDTAVRNNITLRIDVLRNATKSIIQTARTDSEAAKIYRIALYTMHMKADGRTPELKALSNIESSLTSTANAADRITLGVSKGNDYNDTFIDEQLATLAPIVGKSQDGSSQKKSKKYVFIVTDGVRDVPSPRRSPAECKQYSNRCTGPISTASCQAMRDNDVTVGVLYTTYVPIRPIDPKEDDWYQLQVVNTGAKEKAPQALQQCASPGWFFEATDDVQLKAAMAKMFEQTTQAPTLTN
ncbi:TadE/TadG family type IV pilus assembly protein [Hansschlegelia sp. KR7-227]|uniref:TadE/TadG family type IV pilus assembly protein n=1 Tax=Hansschlegelia sp. KR7-227 TaxID=3400914 RepID=UPI003C06D20E